MCIRWSLFSPTRTQRDGLGYIVWDCHVAPNTFSDKHENIKKHEPLGHNRKNPLSISQIDASKIDQLTVDCTQ